MARYPRILTLILALLVLGGCSMKPIPRQELAEDKVSGVLESLEAFRKEKRLARFFEEAEVVAVYPWSFRGASGVGMAYGSGLVFDRDDTPIGYTRMYQLSGGPQLGVQAYRQVLFFKTREVYEQFRRSPAEFVGQLNAAAAIVGYAADPSFNDEIALFTQLRGGLLLEASFSGHRYTFGAIE